MRYYSSVIGREKSFGQLDFVITNNNNGRNKKFHFRQTKAYQNRARANRVLRQNNGPILNDWMGSYSTKNE